MKLEVLSSPSFTFIQSFICYGRSLFVRPVFVPGLPVLFKDLRVLLRDFRFLVHFFRIEFFLNTVLELGSWNVGTEIGSRSSPSRDQDLDVVSRGSTRRSLRVQFAATASGHACRAAPVCHWISGFLKSWKLDLFSDSKNMSKNSNKKGPYFVSGILKISKSIQTK